MSVIALHAHLSQHEIIGLFAGRVHRQSDKITMFVTHAAPTKNLELPQESSSGRRYEVEMDPADAVAVAQRIQREQLCTVGWYHSHPMVTMSAEPSTVDVHNHELQQAHFAGSMFVGIIIAPRARYTDDRDDPQPEMQAFAVFDGQPL